MFLSWSTEGKWQVLVTTNDNPVAGTDAMVFLSVYGSKGKTDDLVLGCGDGHFEAGEEDEFNVSYLQGYSTSSLHSLCPRIRYNITKGE